MEVINVKRRPISRSVSRKYFKKSAGTHRKNNLPPISRGGIRL